MYQSGDNTAFRNLNLARFFLLMVLLAGWSGMLSAQSAGGAGSKPMAVVNGVTITDEQVESAAKADLEKLELQQLQYQAEFARSKHLIFEGNLNRLVDEKLLEAEVAKRGITKEELLAKEVESKVQPPSEADVNAFYEENRAQISMPKEQVAGQIQEYIMEMRHKEAYVAFTSGLKTVYGVKIMFEPLRITVETANHPVRGDAKAPLTIVEFSDFECPYCSKLFSTLKLVEKNYGEKVRLVYRQFPLANHPNAQKAAEAALCANEQGHFWEMHDLMFQEQRALQVPDLKAKAASLKLDAAVFDKCLDSGRHVDRVKQDIMAGSRAGVTGTPAMFINGRFFSGAVPYEDLAKIIDAELSPAAGPAGK